MRFLSQFDVIDVLVNNAGVGNGHASILETNTSDFDLAYQVNVKGIVHTCQAVLPQMVKHKGGVIVNIASLCGLGAIADIPASYTASKFAAVGLTKAVALEFAKDNIRCNAVCPGAVNTRMREDLFKAIAEKENINIEQARQLEDETISLGRGAEPSEIADVVAYLTSSAASYVTGVALPVSGGMSAGL